MITSNNLEQKKQNEDTCPTQLKTVRKKQEKSTKTQSEVAQKKLKMHNK